MKKASKACPLCLMRKDGDGAPADAIMIVNGRDLCPPCLEHMEAIRLVAERCNFNPLEASNFVDALPISGAGHILAGIIFKMARSWGEEQARESLRIKLEQALAAIRAWPADA